MSADDTTGGPATGNAYSHGEGTVKPAGDTETPSGNDHRDRHHTNDGRSLTDDVDPAAIYGGQADVAGYEDEVPGADEDGVG